ncbi:cupin domain-containing protein [Adhaeribacter swui]|uniref:Cupin domain-containing protein n=1 Tax=Adhaeribacter swui TaxID=2086471 RepID=A0A7G7G2Y0_9BACT|nr:cupin domain-containing protein [Adhaeribacter swui]QNF31514.1 cupin domain-containing protein [Adhaeribacter swui]
MTNIITEYIESGILELYILEQVTPAQAAEVEQMAARHPAIRQELDAIRENLEQYAIAHAVQPRPLMKSLFLATVDYMERLQNGETVITPPLLSQTSRVEQYAAWLNRPDFTLPDETTDLHIKIIEATPAVTSAVVWLIDEAEKEVHEKEHERFLVVEGTCTVTAGEALFYLKPGDFYEVPLYTPHTIRVTSPEPCKVVLQRVAV